MVNNSTTCTYTALLNIINTHLNMLSTLSQNNVQIWLIYINFINVCIAQIPKYIMHPSHEGSTISSIASNLVFNWQNES